MSAISGPNGPEGAAEQFKQVSDQFVEDLNRIPGVDEEVIKQVLQGVCEAPPEERFTDSMRIFREELQGKIGEDLHPSDFEIQVVERLVPVLFDRLNPDIEEVQEDFLEVIVGDHDDDGAGRERLRLYCRLRPLAATSPSTLCRRNGNSRRLRLGDRDALVGRLVGPLTPVSARGTPNLGSIVETAKNGLTQVGSHSRYAFGDCG